MDKLGSDKIIKIGLVVRNIEDVVARYAKIFGISPAPVPETHLFTEEDEKAGWRSYRGQNPPLNLKVAFISLQPIYLEFLEPLDDTPTPWLDHLNKHGNSVCFISFYVNGFQQNINYMDGLGYPLLFAQEKGWERYAYFDTMEKLGVLLEVKERDEQPPEH